MKILIIDNTIEPDCWGSKDICRLASLATRSTIYTRRAPESDLPKSPLGFDRIIVSGSLTSALADEPWINQLHEFIKKAVDLKVPYLGICYGHQALARALGGSKFYVRKASSAEFGWTQIQILSDSPLLKGISSSFYSFSAHFEEVAQLPQGMKKLASSRDCEIQACQLESLPVFGIQFHPEKSIAGAKKTFLERKKKGTPPVLLHPNRSEELYDPTIGETIFKNFLKV